MQALAELLDGEAKFSSRFVPGQIGGIPRMASRGSLLPNYCIESITVPLRFLQSTTNGRPGDAVMVIEFQLIALVYLANSHGRAPPKRPSGGEWVDQA